MSAMHSLTQAMKFSVEFPVRSAWCDWRPILVSKSTDSTSPQLSNARARFISVERAQSPWVMPLRILQYFATLLLCQPSEDSSR